MENSNIYVTSPLIPPLEEFIPFLEKIWNKRILTNNGDFHKELEKALADYLGVKYVSLFANGTLALITALQALNIKGEVITTPFSFVATSHSLWWNNIKPVFVDIEPDTFTIDPKKIKAAITEKTTAILPVHVYGNPCNVEEIGKIANDNGLKLIYDAAHTFGVKINGKSIAEFGDLSVLSFHATKVFNTLEGGAIICHDAAMKQHIDDLKNFGFRDETIVVAPGINAKMNEVQAAYGLLSLKYVDDAVLKRKIVAEKYKKALKDINGLSFLDDIKGITHNYSYFPIFVNEQLYGISRDVLYQKLRDNKVFGRRYFYPLISDFAPYNELPSAHPTNLPIAKKIADQVICLPIHHELEMDQIDFIISLITC